MIWSLGCILALAGVAILFGSRFLTSDRHRRDFKAVGPMVSLAGVLTIMVALIGSV